MEYYDSFWMITRYQIQLFKILRQQKQQKLLKQTIEVLQRNVPVTICKLLMHAQLMKRAVHAFKKDVACDTKRGQSSEDELCGEMVAVKLSKLHNGDEKGDKDRNVTKPQC